MIWQSSCLVGLLMPVPSLPTCDYPCLVFASPTRLVHDCVPRTQAPPLKPPKAKSNEIVVRTYKYNFMDNGFIRFPKKVAVPFARVVVEGIDCRGIRICIEVWTNENGWVVVGGLCCKQRYKVTARQACCLLAERDRLCPGRTVSIKLKAR